MEINIISPIHVQVSRQIQNIVGRSLSYKGEVWRRGRFKMERREYTKCLVSKDGYTFAGFLDRILTMLPIPPTITGGIEKVEYDESLEIPLTLREDQNRLVKSALTKQRGVLKAPTGSGKTVLAASIVKKLPNSKVVFLCHTKTLVRQTSMEFQKFGIPCSVFYGEEKVLSNVTIATIQSFSKLDFDEQNQFDVVMIDECHHVSGFATVYGQVLSKMTCAMRIGFTATLPKHKEGELAVEGLLGPMIDEFSLEEGMECGIIAKPTIRLLSIKENSTTLDLSNYKDLYEYGIVKNRYRNNLIASTAIRYQTAGMSSLIMVREIHHGELLYDILTNLGGDPKFVQGNTDSETRELIKKSLNENLAEIVISTAIWYEGVNIPSLCVIINGCGGKSDIRTIQIVGRGLRTTEDKDEIIIVDFLDPYKYLAQHAIQRIRIYVENGWMGEL
jgi:superfamily II DNA or RNA helicase